MDHMTPSELVLLVNCVDSYIYDLVTEKFTDFLRLLLTNTRVVVNRTDASPDLENVRPGRSEETVLESERDARAESSDRCDWFLIGFTTGQRGVEKVIFCP